MNAEAWLCRAIGLDAWVRAKEAEKARWASLRDRVANLGVCADDLREWDRTVNGIDDEIAELLNYRDDVLSVIDSVKDEQLRSLLRMRYLEGLTWREVAGRMFYSMKWVFALKKRAIKEVYTLLCVRFPEINWE